MSPRVVTRNTDVGNARRLIDRCGDDYRWVPAWGTWLQWDGRRWTRDTKGTIFEEAKAVASDLYREALTLDDDERKRLIGWALKSEGASRIEAMVKLARTIPGVAVEPDELDRRPWHLNVENGTVDLRTGQLGPHERDHLGTKLAAVRYQNDAQAPVWTRFLEQVLPDPDLRTFLARWAGYSLTGSVAEQVLVIAFGAGANGKSVLLNALARTLGDYARQAAPDLLMRRRDDPHPTGLADLHGARLVLATETTQGRHFDEALVKRLTGGDRVKARHMHRDFFEFDPTHKLAVATNHRPEIEGTDHAIWRRIRLVPFGVTIADEDQDHSLDEKLAREAPGILRWAVEGCLQWQTAGLTEPLAVIAATADYRAEMDHLGEFISDRCILATTVSATADQLYKAYRAWAEERGETPLTQTKFGRALAERPGLTRRKSGTYRWDGIGLLISPRNGARLPLERKDLA